MQEFLKEFLRENLEITVEYQCMMGSGNNQKVGLRFKGDEETFTEDIIYIPDEYSE